MSQAEERQKRREERQRAEAEDSVRERRQRLIKLVSAAAFLAIIAVVVAVVVSQSGGGSKGGGTDLSGIGKVNAELKGLPQNGPVLGEPSAKVTLIEYGDLQCSTCKAYADSIMPQLFSGPVRSGQAKIEFRAWPIIGPDSIPAAEGAYAAGQQGRFWSYIELFYANQGGENSGYVTDDFQTAVANGAGVPNIDKWNQDRKDPRWKRLLKQHEQQAQAFGFTGTPSFAIQSAGGAAKPVPGQVGGSVLSLGDLEAAINQAG
jgi:protein-disulfide isomerase